MLFLFKVGQFFFINKIFMMNFVLNCQSFLFHQNYFIAIFEE
jgi:hypothetical protein